MKSNARTKTVPDSPFRTLQQVAAYLQVSDKTVRRWIENGDLAIYRIGHRIRIEEGELQAFLHRRREGGKW